MTEFLQPLLERLGVILGSAPSVDVQAGALSAISSVAAAAGTGFTPYARDALVLLRGFMNITEVSPCLSCGCCCRVAAAALSEGVKRSGSYACRKRGVMTS